MVIEPYKDGRFFKFQFSPEEKKTILAHEFKEDLKEKIPPKNGRFWMREGGFWIFSLDYLDEFIDCQNRYIVKKLTSRQAGLFE